MTCPATTYDRASRGPTRCALPAGHEGVHSDGGGLDWGEGPRNPLAYSALPRDLVPSALALRQGLAVRLARVIESRAPIPPACASALAEGILSTLDTHLPDAILAAYQAGKKGSDGR